MWQESACVIEASRAVHITRQAPQSCICMGDAFRLLYVCPAERTRVRMIFARRLAPRILGKVMLCGLAALRREGEKCFCCTVRLSIQHSSVCKLTTPACSVLTAASKSLHCDVLWTLYQICRDDVLAAGSHWSIGYSACRKEQHDQQPRRPMC